MYEKSLIQKVYRHEKTLKVAGLKTDQPTNTGMIQAIHKGKELRESYPDHSIFGFHSPKQRAYLSCVGWLLGANAPISNETLQVSNSLIPDLASLSSSTLKELRNSSDASAKERFYFGLQPIKEAGKNLAGYIAKNFYVDEDIVNKSPVIKVNITHGFTIEYGYLALLGLPLTYESATENGLIKDGDGFDVVLLPDRLGQHGVRIEKEGVSHEFSLEEITARLLHAA